MPSSRSVFRAMVGDIALQGVCERSATGHIGHDLVLPVAYAGVLSTRLSDTLGTLLFPYPTGIAEGDRFDLYWDGGRRYRVLTGRMIDWSPEFSGGGGDILPPVDSPIVLMKQIVINTSFDGDLVQLILAGCESRAMLCFQRSDDTLALVVDLPAGEVWRWIDGDTAPNPLAGETVAYCTVTHADADDEAAMQLALLYDSVA